MISDKIIWEDFSKGESYALSHIYYQNIQMLFRYGKKISKDDGIIKDTIQDLFIDLIRTRENIGETDNIKFYLIKSFRRKLFKNLKKRGLLEENEEKENLKVSIEYSIEKEIIEKEELTHKERVVQEGLMKLSPKQREILFYRFMCEFDYDQICEIMSLKYDSARKQVFRALKSLKKCLSEQDVFVLFLGFFTKKQFSRKK